MIEKASGRSEQGRSDCKTETRSCEGIKENLYT